MSKRLIYAEDAIDAFRNHVRGGHIILPYEYIKDIVLSLPSAQPQRMKGRWERKESDLSWWFECSKCGESPLYNPYADEVLTSFCPWCGAEMRGDEDEA